MNIHYFDIAPLNTALEALEEYPEDYDAAKLYAHDLCKNHDIPLYLYKSFCYQVDTSEGEEWLETEGGGLYKLGDTLDDITRRVAYAVLYVESVKQLDIMSDKES